MSKEEWRDAVAEALEGAGLSETQLDGIAERAAACLLCDRLSVALGVVPVAPENGKLKSAFFGICANHAAVPEASKAYAEAFFRPSLENETLN